MLVLEVAVVLGAVEEVEVAGLRAAAAVPVVVLALLSPGLLGLDIKELVRLAVVVVGFFSSSLALTLGRLRWLAADVEPVVGRRVVVVVGGRVGGLLRPPEVREEAVVLVRDVVVVAVPGRRVVVVVVPGRLTVVVVVGLVEPLDLGLAASGVDVASGEEGVGVDDLSSSPSLGTSEADSAATEESSSSFSD